MLLVSGVDRLDQRHWVPMAEQATNVIYKLAEHPDTICSTIIKRVAKVVVSHSQRAGEGSSDGGSDKESSTQTPAPGETDQGREEDKGECIPCAVKHELMILIRACGLITI